MQHDRDAGHYEEVCNVRRENGKRGGRPKSKPDGFEIALQKLRKQKKPKRKIKIKKKKQKKRKSVCVAHTITHILFLRI